MLNMSAFAFVPNVPAEVSMEEVTEDATCHKSWAALGLRVLLHPEVKETLVEWTERDAHRADTGDEVTSEVRLHNLFAEAAPAVRNLQYGATEQTFLAEYFDRNKRGNPRRTKVKLIRNEEVVVIAFPD